MFLGTIQKDMLFSRTLVALAVVGSVQWCHCIQLSVDVDHDLTQPTYGLEGKTSSAVHYDDRNGLNLKGTISDLLGPPIKMANGVQNIFKGHNLAGLGTGLKTGGAMLGIDAKVFETAGAGNLIKGGLLMNGANAKSNLAGELAGQKGQQIANLIEVPVRVVAMKDIATGNMLNGIGQLKQTGAEAVSSKGQQLMNQGQNMKAAGMNQIIQGAQEGVKNIGNMVQKTSENFNTAFKLLPIVWDMHQQQQIQQQEEEAAKGQLQQVTEQHQHQQQQQQHLVSTPHQMSAPAGSSLTGGSLFGGLSSLMPGMGGTNVFTDGGGLGSGGFGSGSAPNSAYAALLNSTSPLTNLLMNPRTNPILYPLAQGPFGQAVAGLQPIGTLESQSGGGSTKTAGQSPQTGVYDFNLFPGLRYKETVSSQLPTFGFGQQQQGKMAAGKTQQIVNGQEGVKGHPQQQVQQVQQIEQQQVKTKN